MPRPHAPISSHRRPIGRFFGADFDRRLLALRQVHSRRAPTGRAHLSRHAVENRRTGARCQIQLQLDQVYDVALPL